MGSSVRFYVLVVGLIGSLSLLSGCESPTNAGSNLQVSETGIGPGRQDIEVIHLNNCDGKADATQSIERGQIVQIEGGAELGVDINIIEAAVTGNYTRGLIANKRIELTAPPGTNMEFTLQWTLDERNGSVSREGRTAFYRYLTPNDVQIQAQKDIGCKSSSGSVSTAPPDTERLFLSTTQAIQPSDTQVPQIDIPTYPPSTPIPPTNTQIPPTFTPIPSPTPLPDTPPGTILEIGQTWRQEGVEILLRDPKPWIFPPPNMPGEESGMAFKVYFTNRKPQDISISYSGDINFTASDNTGRQLLISDVWEGVVASSCGQQTRIVTVGDTINLGCRDYSYILAYVDIGNTSITEIIFTVSGVSSIYNASWRIPIYH